MATITAQGITGETLQQYLDRFEQGYLDIDADWNVEPESPDGQILAIWSEQLALYDEQLQYTYMSRDPGSAIGQALDDIASYAGIERQGPTFSVAIVQLTGTNGTIIPAGNRVRNSRTNTLWALDSDTTISGITAASVTAEEAGALTAAIGELDTIADPVAGWSGVTNDESASVGDEKESDEDFRLRRSLSVALPGANQVDNMFSAVANVGGVLQARVYENPTSSSAVTSENPHGIAAHSIAIFAQGGDVDELFSAIAAKKNPGCGMNRDGGIPNENVANTTTPLGNPISITFFRPDIVSIFVRVTVNSTELSEAEKLTIKEAIVDFSVNGFLGCGDGFTRRGFRIGERIASGKLYTPVNEVVGEKGAVELIEVGTIDPPSSQMVSIAFNELGVFDVDNIVVEYVS